MEGGDGLNAGTMISTFKKLFQQEDYRTFFSPGRINLIGEHTDYNGGHVFPCAITFGTYGLARRREDRVFRLYSMNFPTLGVIEFGLDHLEFNKAHEWVNYPKGMIRYLIEAGFPIETGMDILVYGNIPNGAGLSSSASIELLIGVMAEKIYQFEINRLDLVKIGKRVENEFIHVNSGIMDQFAVGMGKKDCAILLDCQSHHYQYAPIKLEHHKIMIMNTNKRRELADSKYNLRRSECEQTLAQLNQVVQVNSLGELTIEEFEKYKHVIEDDTLAKRAKHAVYENQRTLKAHQRLQNGDLNGFGQLMNESHISLRDDYEVTGLELDTLVEAAWKQEGVVGARMTGAGFGGCAIAIVEENLLDRFIINVGTIYKERIGYEATFYKVSIGKEASELRNEDFLAV
jgi:galactokinase